MAGQSGMSSSGPFTTPTMPAAAAPNLSFGSGSTIIAAPRRLTRPAWAPFRVRAPARYPASYPRRAAGGAAHTAVVSCRLSTCRPSLLGSSCPRRGVVPSSRSAYHHTTRCRWTRRDCHVPHAQDPAGVGALSIPGRRCSHDQHRITGRRLPLPSGQSCTPCPASHPKGLNLTGHPRGFTCVHPSGLPLAGNPRMVRRSLGFYP
jgi:hypothetical protein